MRQYTGYEYLLIDIANQFGKDKCLFEERIQWAKDNILELEKLADQAEYKPLYLKAVMALRKAQAGAPTGHLVGLDCVCSGIQVMSVMSGCISGATATGLVDPSKRADAYSAVSLEMTRILGNAFSVSRAKAKKALMTVFYGSKAKPKEIFGEDTPELNAFYEAAVTIAPGAWDVLQCLLGSWKPYALLHEWQLPDGFNARVKVMSQKETRIEVDELDHATFSYQYYENEGSKRGLSNAANVVHSIDGYVLRCIQRRCNYDEEVTQNAATLIEMELIKRTMKQTSDYKELSKEIRYYVSQYKRSTVADVVIIPYLNEDNIGYLQTNHLEQLAEIIEYMLSYFPFEVVTIHDEFKVHPNNCNVLRQQYINIMAQLAESNLLSDLLSQLRGSSITYKKLSNNLGQLIRSSEYALS